jgi:hypothetical protein
MLNHWRDPNAHYNKEAISCLSKHKSHYKQNQCHYKQSAKGLGVHCHTTKKTVTFKKHTKHAANRKFQRGRTCKHIPRSRLYESIITLWLHSLGTCHEWAHPMYCDPLCASQRKHWRCKITEPPKSSCISHIEIRKSPILQPMLRVE